MVESAQARASHDDDGKPQSLHEISKGMGSIHGDHQSADALDDHHIARRSHQLQGTIDGLPVQGFPGAFGSHGRRQRFGIRAGGR